MLPYTPVLEYIHASIAQKNTARPCTALHAVVVLLDLRWARRTRGLRAPSASGKVRSVSVSAMSTRAGRRCGWIWIWKRGGAQCRDRSRRRGACCARACRGYEVMRLSLSRGLDQRQAGDRAAPRDARVLECSSAGRVRAGVRRGARARAARRTCGGITERSAGRGRGRGHAARNAVDEHLTRDASSSARVRSSALLYTDASAHPRSADARARAGAPDASPAPACTRTPSATL
ncbi:hypothetical protein BC834DRAFT_408272 [Gloeopeniophorella convolvens]|nr:hypothetical protein BC834DRAFT_408272 [Gloeopeniophorella convolvens]